MLNPIEIYEELNSLFPNDYHDFIKLIPICKQFDYNEIALIYKALYKAMELHKGQVRKTGEPYINHPIAVAGILAAYGFDYETVCAALLHDTVEDTGYTLKECEKDFGPVIASLVDNVTKIGKGVNEPTHIKLIKSAEKDIRTIAIKLADRLHNMLTLYVFNQEKIDKKANETLNFYVPITKILGIYRLKDLLQDLCLYYLDNKTFFEFKNKREILKVKNNNKLKELADITQEDLSKIGISMYYNYRVKNIGGIYEDMQDGKKMDEIEDLYAIKMIVKEPMMCYQSLGVVHKYGRLILGGVNDFIASPKSNGYKSLNTNITYKGLNIQTRIRSEAMQKVNDMGVFSDLNADTQKNVTNQMYKELTKLAR